MDDSRRQQPRPAWWNAAHDSAWDRVKHLFQRRIESEPDGREWTQVERAVQFGYGARQQAHETGTDEWDADVEAQLEREWDTLHYSEDLPPPAHTWHDVRQFVHRGWVGP